MRLLSSYERRRMRLGKKAPAGPVKRYLTERWPPRESDALGCSMLALDLETSGLNPARDEIVSAGWVRLAAGRILLDSAEHHLVRPGALLPASSVIVHGIVDARAATGRPLAAVLEEALEALRGRVLLGHNVHMDAAFLAEACRRLGWGIVAFPCIDTLLLSEERNRRNQVAVGSGALTLSELRKGRQMPAYPAHDALWDAISASELWLALAQDIAGRSGTLPLKDLVHVWP